MFRGRSNRFYKKKVDKTTPLPTSVNATVQAWLNKIGVSGYVYPSQAKVDVYTTAFNYADAQGLTNQFDLLCLGKVENKDLVKVPMINVAGAAARCVPRNENEIVLDPNFGITNDLNTGTLSGSYDTNYNPFTQAVNVSLNNICIGAFVYKRITGSIDTNGGIMGSNKVNAPNSRLFVRTFSNIIQGTVCVTNNTFLAKSETLTDDALISARRTNSTNEQLFMNGIQQATLSLASASLPNVNIALLVPNVTSGTTDFGCFSNGYMGVGYVCNGGIDQVKLNTFVNLLLS